MKLSALTRRRRLDECLRTAILDAVTMSASGGTKEHVGMPACPDAHAWHRYTLTRMIPARPTHHYSQTISLPALLRGTGTAPATYMKRFSYPVQRSIIIMLLPFFLAITGPQLLPLFAGSKGVAA